MTTAVSLFMSGNKGNMPPILVVFKRKEVAWLMAALTIPSLIYLLLLQTRYGNAFVSHKALLLLFPSCIFSVRLVACLKRRAIKRLVRSCHGMVCTKCLYPLSSRSDIEDAATCCPECGSISTVYTLVNQWNNAGFL